MDSNEETVQKRVVVNSPYQRSEVLTERTERVPRESRLSTGTIAIVAILAIAAIAVDLYIVSNRNANESANRNANLEVASQARTGYDSSTTGAASTRDHSATGATGACDHSAACRTKPAREYQRE